MADSSIPIALRDNEASLVGKTLSVSVKVDDGGTDWFTAVVKRQRAKGQVLVAWENGDEDEWIDLKSEVYKEC